MDQKSVTNPWTTINTGGNRTMVAAATIVSMAVEDSENEMVSD